MSKLLQDWIPSEPAIDLIKLNGIDSTQIEQSLEYLKGKSELSDIDDVRVMITGTRSLLCFASKLV